MYELVANGGGRLLHRRYQGNGTRLLAHGVGSNSLGNNSNQAGFKETGSRPAVCGLYAGGDDHPIFPHFSTRVIIAEDSPAEFNVSIFDKHLEFL